MKKLNTIHKRVLGILENSPEARVSTKDLYCEYIKKFYGEQMLSQPFILTLKDKNLPDLETVSRAKRKCLELYPWLRPSDDVQAVKDLYEEEFREYAKRVD